jgi:hypothetical protein
VASKIYRHPSASTARVGHLETLGMVLVEAITLEGMHCNCCLVLIVKFNKTQDILSCGILFAFFGQQAKRLVAREWSENIWALKTIVKKFSSL